MTDPVLYVVAKAPALGRGKSRLAEGLGRVEALRINRALHRATMMLAQDVRWRTVLALTPDHAARSGVALWPKSIMRVAQGQGDLGARLARLAHATPPRTPLVFIGTDCLSLTRAHIARALHAAKRDGVHVIPATDGGFVLLAARSRTQLVGLFDAVRWSSPHTLADVMRNAQARGQRIAAAAALSDIDEPADWRVAKRARTP